MSRFTARQMTAIVFVCVVARLAIFVLNAPWRPGVESRSVLSADAMGYHQLALTLKDHQRFSFGPDAEPNALRTPMFPLLISSVYFAVGPRPWAVLLVHILIDTIGCCVLVYVVSSRLGGRVGLWSGLLYALDPHLAPSCSTLLSDTLFVFFLVLGFAFLAREPSARPGNRSYVDFGLGSLCWGLAALTRPVAQYLILVIVFLAVLRFRREPGKTMRCVVLSAFVFAAALAPWLARNYLRFGVVSLSNAGSYNLLVLYVGLTEQAGKTDTTYSHAKRSLLAEADSLALKDGRDMRDLDPFEKAEYWRAVSLAHIKAEPMRFVRSSVRGLRDFFFTVGAAGLVQAVGAAKLEDRHPPSSPLEKIRELVTRGNASRMVIGGAMAFCMIVAYLGAVVGLIVGWKRCDRVFLAFSLVTALYFVVTSGAAAMARFRLPAIPFYLAFSGIGIAHAEDVFRRRRSAIQRLAGRSAG